MKPTVKREALGSICGLVLFIGACPKRQTTPRIVYVPAPPPATSPAASVTIENPQTMVIEEPAPPPEPEETEAKKTTEDQKQAPRRRKVLRTEPPHSSDETPAESAGETPEAPPAQVPALEPRESSAQESTLRRQTLEAQIDVRQRLARINEAQLTPPDRKTLDDARGFFGQSERALQEGDLQRSLVLARKAALLVTALEQH